MQQRHGHVHVTDIHPAQTQGNIIRWASYYDLMVKMLMVGQAAALRQQTVNLAQIKEGDRVLEVGCGTGEVTMVAKERAGATGQVVGIDPSPEMIAVARQKAERKGIAIDYRLGVIEALPFTENSFDVVVSSLMMHHLPETLKTQGLAEIQRVLHSDGHLLIVDFKMPTSFFDKFILTMMYHGGQKSDVADLPPKLESAGFHNISAGSLNMKALGYVSGKANKKK